jgi:hypothetical protein
MAAAKGQTTTPQARNVWVQLSSGLELRFSMPAGEAQEARPYQAARNEEICLAGIGDCRDPRVRGDLVAA